MFLEIIDVIFCSKVWMVYLKFIVLSVQVNAQMLSLSNYSIETASKIAYKKLITLFNIILSSIWSI